MFYLIGHGFVALLDFIAATLPTPTAAISTKAPGSGTTRAARVDAVTADKRKTAVTAVKIIVTNESMCAFRASGKALLNWKGKRLPNGYWKLELLPPLEELWEGNPQQIWKGDPSDFWPPLRGAD